VALQILLNDTYKLNHCKEMGAKLGRRFLKQPAEKLKAVFVAKCWSHSASFSSFALLMKRICLSSKIHLTFNFTSLLRSTHGTFVYLFSQPNRNNIYPSWLGADHADELPYVFAKPFRSPQRFTDSERAMSDAIMTYWTNFAWRG